MSKNFIFSSESVGEGHPDKIADYISDSILDACLEQDPDSRVACETLVKSNLVVLAGEITTKANIAYETIVRQAIRDIGYVDEGNEFHADKVFIMSAISRQSLEIAQGVDKHLTLDGKVKKSTSGTREKQGAGDQGVMFGYACNETEEFLPMPVAFAHRLTRELARVRRSNKNHWLRPDCKAQVAVEYVDGKAVEIKNVIISTQHDAKVSQKEIRNFCIEQVIKKVLPKELISKNTEFYINPVGSFVVGGPSSDAGVTGRKIMVDTYGGWARHGGGAFSGKDASKVDRSAAYMCRWVTKNLVAAGFAERLEMQVAYAIGHAEPTSMSLNDFGTAKLPVEELLQAVKALFSFRPGDITEQLNLRHPIYRSTTFYGHFTHPKLPWEQLNRVKDLKAYFAHRNRSKDIPGKRK